MTDLAPNRLWAPEAAAFRAICGVRLQPRGGANTQRRAPSDFDLNPGAEHDWRVPDFKAAAVLIPVIAREQLSVLLTERPPDMPAHAGQIAFPGGKVDSGDAHPIATALREASEEIGLPRRYADVLGVLDRYRTGTGYEITPVVALIDPDFEPKADVREVASIFEVPLAFLMAPENHHHHTREIAGQPRHFYAMPYGERYIWGATAGILKSMHERLYSE